jgi:hypothetical protein
MEDGQWHDDSLLALRPLKLGSPIIACLHGTDEEMLGWLVWKGMEGDWQSVGGCLILTPPLFLGAA